MQIVWRKGLSWGDVPNRTGGWQTVGGIDEQKPVCNCCGFKAPVSRCDSCGYCGSRRSTLGIHGFRRRSHILENVPTGALRNHPSAVSRCGTAVDDCTGGDGGHGGEFDVGSGSTAGLVADVQPVKVVILHVSAFQNVVVDNVGSSGVGGHLRIDHHGIHPPPGFRRGECALLDQNYDTDFPWSDDSIINCRGDFYRNNYCLCSIL